MTRHRVRCAITLPRAGAPPSRGRTGARTRRGAVPAPIAGETDRSAAQKLSRQTGRSVAEDLGMVGAVCSVQNKQRGDDAALKSYWMVQRLSLFQYLGG